MTKTCGTDTAMNSCGKAFCAECNDYHILSSGNCLNKPVVFSTEWPKEKDTAAF